MDDELLCLFINESREHLVTIEADLLAIEEAGAEVDIDLVNKVFRAAHSIKGTSSFFGLNKVTELAHKAETVLDMLRSRQMTANAEITNLLLAAFDKLREMINNSNESENEDIAALVTSLTDLVSSYIPHEHKASLTQTLLQTAKENGVPEEAFALTPEFSEAAPIEAQPTSVPALKAKPQASTAKPAVSSTVTAVTVEDSIRVNVGVLERLMNLAGELVLGRNQLRASIAQNNSRALVTADQRINQITSELQDVIMQTRLQPIGNVFGKFPRVVRDLSGALGKEIELDIRGKDVALDKSLIESLSDPLTHMVRNAVDHGIESPEDRVRAGKKRQGTVVIDAHHEAGQVVVEIADDGQGIDPERIGQAAESKGLISQDQLKRMSAQDKIALIFLPGLSTAEKLTDISGRGVGMDVVKTNLDRLGGKVEIVSVQGKGTTFRIKLPLTLAIIPSLIVSVAGERFAIPQINVEELLRVQPGKTKARIEILGGSEVLVLRDRLIPLVRFASLVGVEPTYIDTNADDCRNIDRRERLADRCSPCHPDVASKDAQHTDALAGFPSRRGVSELRRSTAAALEIAVVTTGTLTFGLVVDAFHDTEEIVVKPLGSHLKGLREYAGATILGDGTVALILDVAGLATMAEIDVASGTERALEHNNASEQDRLNDTHALLLFHNGPDQLCAVPLDTVLRIERIRPEQVETIGGRRTMQHRGGFLPLVTLSDTAQVNPIGDAKELAVMISNIRGHDVGLLGAMPVDVIETNAQIDQDTHRQNGVAGSAIIRTRTALVVDLFELVDAAWPEWAAQRAVEKPKSFKEEDRVVLLAEDSDFFRSQMSRFLEEDGYTVLTAPDGEAAWDLLVENVDRVRMVVTDIEMPRLDGLDLTRRIRADERTAGLPIIAVTSLASDEDFARGKAVGVNEYQTKLDRDNLLAGLQRLMTADATIELVPA
jgi:two-component system chemotaxis sensor kinase CheA